MGGVESGGFSAAFNAAEAAEKLAAQDGGAARALREMARAWGVTEAEAALALADEGARRWPGAKNPFRRALAELAALPRDELARR